MKARVYLMLLLGLALALAPAWARAQDSPVSLSAQPAKLALAPGATATVLFPITVAPEYHINSDKPADPDLVPTLMEFHAPAGISLGAPEYPPPDMLDLPFDDKPMAMFGGDFAIQAEVSAAPDAAPGPRQVKALLSFQACTGEVCLMPMQIETTLTVEVTE